ncbi:MAG: hypothetical protein IIA61_02430 [Candidatus Marinimicrobia bacterium]|nr:hypothetical protein [Candidatus Neomarinimicrobiota bacterium]
MANNSLDRLRFMVCPKERQEKYGCDNEKARDPVFLELIKSVDIHVHKSSCVEAYS